MRRSDGREVGTAEAQRNDVVLENVEVFFSDVIITDGVLEGQVELVVLLHHLVAVALVSSGALVLDRTAGALAVNVNVHVLLHRLGILLPPGLRCAMGHEPGSLQLRPVAPGHGPSAYSSARSP